MPREWRKGLVPTLWGLGRGRAPRMPTQPSAGLTSVRAHHAPHHSNSQRIGEPNRVLPEAKLCNPIPGRENLRAQPLEARLRRQRPGGQGGLNYPKLRPRFRRSLSDRHITVAEQAGDWEIDACLWLRLVLPNTHKARRCGPTQPQLSFLDFGPLRITCLQHFPVHGPDLLRRFPDEEGVVSMHQVHDVFGSMCSAAQHGISRRRPHLAEGNPRPRLLAPELGSHPVVRARASFPPLAWCSPCSPGWR